MKRKIMEKKWRFQYCTAVMATALLVSANGFSTAAQESGNTQTMRSSIYLEAIDSGGGQKSKIEQKLLLHTADQTIVIEPENSSPPESNTLENKNPSIEETSSDSDGTTMENSSTYNNDFDENNSDEKNETVPNTDNSSENTETEVIETEVINTEVIESEITETEVIESEVINTEVIETEVIESVNAETEIVETPSTDENNTVETDSTPNSTENNDSCICDIHCSDSNINQNCPVCAENFADCTATIVIDLIETPINEAAIWFCSLIDSLPTAEQLYAEAPDSRDELYSTWLSNTKEILLQIGELQEQYHLFSDADKAFIGVERKTKLEALGEMAEKLLEDNVVYDVDISFTDDKGLLYEVLKENNSQVQIVSNGNYISVLENSLTIPSQVTDENNNNYTVVSIGERAFSGCSNLTDVSIPDSIKNINAKAFLNCNNLETVTISDNITIDNQAFSGCSKLSTLKIKVSSSAQISSVPVYDIDVFNNCPFERNAIFILNDGTELTNKTTPRLVTAVNAYKAVNDGNTNDYLWYGWTLKTPTFAATPSNIYKDNIAWSNPDRTFALKVNGSEELITDLTAVKNGTYIIIDNTDSNKPLDTGATVTINDDDSSNQESINYYTVTFYDPDNAYNDSTPQKPQIILKDKPAVMPPDPIKEGFTFDGWKTTKEGGQSFDFENTTITTTTSIYASWIDNAKQEHRVTIKVQLDDKEWTDHNRIFMLKGADNSQISPENAVDGEYTIIDITNDELNTGIPVKVDGADADATVDYYTVTFYNDTEVHNTQIVLKGQTAKTPPEPTKEGYTFVKWKVSQDSDTEFDFTAPITARTDVYADWTIETYYTITPSKEGNGTISPDIETKVKSGDAITFTFTPENGYHIKDVLIDDTAMQTSGNTYTFTNVTQNHTIKVIFEADDPGDDDNKPGDNPDGDDDNPSGDDNKPDDDPSGDDNKPDDDPSGDDNKPDDDPSGDDNKPGDNPGGDDDKPGENPGGDDNKPGENPGGDDNKPGENPGGDDNKPGDDNNKPGDDNNKPGDDSNKPDDNNTPSGGDTPTTGAENNSSNSNSSNTNNSSATSSSTANTASAASNPLAANTTQSEANIASDSIYPNTAIPNGITDPAFRTTSDIAPEGTLSDTAKDAEPQTGEANGIEPYAIIAIAASIALLLLQLLENKKRKNAKSSILPVVQNYRFWHRKQQNYNMHDFINQRHFQQNYDKILGVIWTKRKQYCCLSG